MTKHDFSNYLSPFSWRYGSQTMRTLFSEKHKYELWRRVWVSLAEAQYQQGLVTKAELDDLKRNQDNIAIDEILAIEHETKHDVVAAIREYAHRSKVGGGKIHLGATSMDIVDNADAMRIMQALGLIDQQLQSVLTTFASRIEQTADIACIGYTHLQPAEPTTVGYRLSFYAHELLLDWQLLQFVQNHYRAKGLKGAVGTAASYTVLLKEKKASAQELEATVLAKLGLKPALITSQINSRKFDYLILTLLSSIGESAYKFASDIRLLQSPSFGEWSEPFAKTQVGSSAMPFKRNPRMSENICSLARFTMHLPTIVNENAAHSYLERTLDDSANRRSIIPEAFLAIDEILLTQKKIIVGLQFNEKRIAYNLHQYAPFAVMEPLFLRAVQNGADRQEVHEILRTIALKAWRAVENGDNNPMEILLHENKKLRQYISNQEITDGLAVERHVGDAPKRAKKLVREIAKVLQA